MVNYEIICVDPGWQITTDEKIIESTKLKTTTEKNEDDKTEIDTISTHFQAFEASEIAMMWSDSQSEANFMSIKFPTRARDSVAFKQKKNKNKVK